jgi:O-antigen/teichoic acid export membrane protein
MGIVQKASIKLTVVSYAGAALGYFNKILLFTNFLHPDQVGLIDIMNRVSALFAQFAVLGMTSVGVRFFPYFEDKKKQHHGFLFWSNFVITVGFLASTLLFIFIKPVVIRYYQKDSPLLIEFYYYIIPLAFGLLYFQFLESYLRALLKTVVSTIAYELVGRLLVTATITLYVLKLINFHQFVLLYVLGNCVVALTLLVYAAYLKQLFLRPVISSRLMRLIKIVLVYGFYTILSALGGQILGIIDALMVAAKLNLAQEGIYGTVFLMTTVMMLPYRSILKITHPLLARFWKERNLDSMAELYRKTTLTDMVAGGFFFLLLWLNIFSIFRFMPGEYYSAKYVFLLLAIARYVDMATGINGLIIITSKKFRFDLWCMLFLIVTTIALNWILIPRYNILGSAIATLISISLYNILRVIFVQYFYKMQPFSINCLWVLLITLAVWGIASLLPDLHNKYVDMALKSAVVTVLYCTPIVLFKLSDDVNGLLYSYTKIKYFKPKNG